MLFYDHNQSGDPGDQSVLGLLGGGKFTPVELQRGALSSSATGLAATKSCPVGQEFDTIDNVCRASSTKLVPFVPFLKLQRAAPTATSTVTPSVVAPAPTPPPLFLVAPIPPSTITTSTASDLSPVFLPATDPSFLEKEIAGGIKVKHALLGGGLALLGIAGVLVVRSRKE